MKLVASDFSEHENEPRRHIARPRRVLYYFLRLREESQVEFYMTDANTWAQTRAEATFPQIANPRNDFARVRGTSWQRRRHLHPVA